MFESFPLVLLVAGAVAGVIVAILAAWRMIPHRAGPNVNVARLESVEDAIDALRLSLIEIADKYEITVRRNHTRVGKLRSKVARLQGEDEDEDEDVGPAPAAPMAPVPQHVPTKAEMWAVYNAGRPV